MRLHDLPLRTQLVVVFAFLSITTTTVSTITLAGLSGHRMHEALTARAERIAARLQSQLQSVVEFDDQRAARDLFAAYAGDRELDGIAVYADGGDLIEGRGNRPPRLAAGEKGPPHDGGHVTATADVHARNGRQGRLYVSFSTRLNDAVQRHDSWVAAAIGASVALFALLLAERISRHIGRRLASIADAADRMAAGDPSRPSLDDHPGDEIGALAKAFNIMVSELNRLSGEHEQLVSTERERLESLVLERTKELERSREMFKLMAESTRAIPFTLDLTRGCFTYIGTQSITDVILEKDEWARPGSLERAISRDTNPELRQHFDRCESGPFEFLSALFAGERRSELRWTGTCEVVQGIKYLRGLMLDVTEVRRVARDLAAAQKLESIGRLAAGVAHEINTPVQFVSDNVQFVGTSMADIGTVLDAYRCLKHDVRSGGDTAEAARRADEVERAADLDYLMENAPLAIESAIEGLARIATIVRSMKEFAHPDQAQKTLADLNQAIRSTLVVAHNEYKYVATVDTQFGDLPQVECYLGEINQVVLNLLVNAAHAISDVVKGTGDLGKLTVRTRVDGDSVEISIADTGTGIPASVRDKIFDPFF
ncbi:MAG: sensor histidine kinase, partial [Gammaproteobacteria bacterium]|nr:sensor histidine kinase [Gammaproteobacteria bacterium]